MRRTSSVALVFVLLIGCEVAPVAEADRWKAEWSRESVRWIEGRPSGGLTYLPLGRPPAGDGSATTRANESRGALEAISAANPSSFSRALEAARLELLDDNWDRAILILERLRNRQVIVSAELLNDLAVAYLQKADREDRPSELFKARRLLDQAEPASRGGEEPGVRSAVLFNQALCLEKLYLKTAARLAWREYLSADGEGGWGREARARLARLERHTRDVRWQKERLRLLAGAKLESGVVDEFPLEVRELAEEEALVAWAVGQEDKVPALALKAGELLLSRRGDGLLADGLAGLARAETAGRLYLARQAQLSYIVARRYYRVRKYDLALPLFERAETLYREFGSPYALQARLYRSICIYQGSVKAAGSVFLELASKVDEHRYPSLAGRALWMAGTPQMVQGRMESAITFFERMRSLLARGDGKEQAAIADINLAASFETRGENERAWRFLLEGISSAADHTASQRRYSPLFQAAIAARNQKEWRLAELYLDEAWAESATQTNATFRAEIWAERSRIYRGQGNLSKALRASHVALAEVGSIADAGEKNRMAAIVDLTSAALLVKSDPAAAIPFLEKVSQHFAADGWRMQAGEVSHLQAAAWRQLGNFRETRKFLLESVKRFDALRRDAMAPEVRIRSFEQAREAIDSLVELSLAQAPENPLASLADAEKTRREIIDGRRIGPYRKLSQSDDEEAAMAGQLANLPSNVTVIEYYLLEHQLVSWTLSQGKILLSRQNIDRSKIEKLVSGFRSSLQNGRTPEVELLGGELYDLLIAPAVSRISHDGLLVLIPDGPLATLPFAALYDRARQQNLVQRTELTTLPSLLFADFTATPSARRDEVGGTLVVGAPHLAESAWSDLPELPAASEELREVGSFYRRPQLLQGTAATRSAFLAALPRHQVIHFAGHGVSTGPGIEDQILLLTPDPDGHAEVTGEDLLHVDLENTRVAVLAVCSGFGGIQISNQGRWGLASSLLLAGADAVVAAQWDIDDRYTRHFMNQLHEGLADRKRPSQALREVMLTEQRRHRPNAEKWSWTAFSITGF